MALLKKLKIFSKLNKVQIFLLPIVWILLGIMRIVILTTPFRLIAKFFLNPTYKKNFLQKKNLAINIGKSVAIMAKYTPWESKCLAQGLAVRFLFRIFSIPSTFYIGINYDKDNNFISHAWVNLHDTTIIGGSNSFDNFKIIQQFEDK